MQVNTADGCQSQVSPALGRNGPPVHKRYLSNQPRRNEAYTRAAKDYTFKIEKASRDWLYIKPFEASAGNITYYQELYQVLNLLEAMDVPQRGRILEVGSGSGWVTEMLLGLGFEVDAIEPSEDMIQIAQERIASRAHHPTVNLSRARFYPLNLEECPLPDDIADAILFHESLHHVIDEEKGLAQCFRVLAPGGVLGVSGDSNWHPGNRDQEGFWKEVMTQFGALENPFTFEYLKFILEKHGFTDINRYHGANGLFPVDQEHLTIKEVARFSAEWYNNIIARKPGPNVLTSANSPALTRGEIHLIDVGHDKNERRAHLRVRLVNRGETTWLHRPLRSRGGDVTLALAQKDPSRPQPGEALNRCPIPRSLPPGEELVMEAAYSLPEGYQEQPWYLDLINESRFWYSSRGMPTVEVRFQ